jgi:hypothetical protein
MAITPKLSANRLSNNPSTRLSPDGDTSLSDIIPEGGILPRTKSPSRFVASGSDSIRATTPATVGATHL